METWFSPSPFVTFHLLEQFEFFILIDVIFADIEGIEIKYIEGVKIMKRTGFELIIRDLILIF